MRIVSLNCSNTEIVCALGCASMLVGVDDHSDHPSDVVAALPRVGPDLFIDADRVAALRPDLVLASLTVPGHERVLEGLTARGLPFIAPEPVSLADIERDVRDIADRLGVPERGEALVHEMQTAMPAVIPEGPRPEVLVEWWPKPPIVPGRDSWVTDLLHRAGGRNPWHDRDFKSKPVSEAEAARLDADAVVLSWCGIATDKYRPHVVLQRKAWQHMRALREGQVHCVAEAFLGRPGPRVVEGYRALRAIVDGCR